MKFHIKLVLGIIFVAFGVYLYGSMLDGIYIRPVSVIYEDPLKLTTDKTEYHRGDTVYVKVKYCKLRDYSSKTQWNLENGTVIPYTNGSTKNYPVGCYGIDKERFIEIGDIPSRADVGPHHFVGDTVITHYSPMDVQIIKHYETVYFNIK